MSDAVDVPPPKITDAMRLHDALPGPLPNGSPAMALFSYAARLLAQDGRVAEILDAAEAHKDFLRIRPHLNTMFSFERTSLRKGELIWSALFSYFLARGYRLPSRYKDGAIGAWLETTRLENALASKAPSFVAIPESAGLAKSRLKTIQATASDGSTVMIKLARSSSVDVEYRLHQLLSSAEWMKDARNHTIPILDSFALPIVPDDYNDVQQSFTVVVLPLMDGSPGVDCFPMDGCLWSGMRQVLEGLVFYHSLGIAHGDISWRNMVASKQGPPFRIFFIDFECASIPQWDELQSIQDVSSRFGTPSPNRIITKRWNPLRPAPEIQNTTKARFDPFKADVWSTCKSFDIPFRHKDKPFSAYSGLWEAMQEDDPLLRISAVDALTEFDRISAATPWRTRLRYFLPRDNPETLLAWLHYGVAVLRALLWGF